MTHFNENTITTGFIKQLLSSFNLPLAKTYIDDDKTPLYEGGIFLKDDYIIQYKDNKEIPLFPFEWDKRVNNYTSNLILTESAYDYHTHEYLGEYLRFIRDYKKLNLMSLYNCFSNHILNNAAIPFHVENATLIKDDKASEYFLSDNGYKLYILPVKFNQKYTIAIDASCGYDILCAFIDSDYYNVASETGGSDIESLTYQRVSNSSFDKPFIYNKLATNDFDPAYRRHEKDLHLLIRLPISVDSSITILEGDYTGFCDKTLTSPQPGQSKTSTWINNSAVINFESDKTDFSDLKYYSNIQLLSLNSHVSHPFSDRLLEYLCDNAVTNLDTISDNIVRLQEILRARATLKTNKIGLLTDYTAPGIWNDKYRRVMYSIMSSEGLLNTTNDVLGYMDKDVERILQNDEPDIYQDN